MPIPVVDLFAGPGGLGEGFSSYIHPLNGERVFRVGVSIEKDPVAHRTLELRAFYRSFLPGAPPDAYYEYLRGRITKEELQRDKRYRDEWRHASAEAVRAELGSVSEETVDGFIKSVIGTEDRWVLIGGPPCQAYSLVGRSRLKGGNPDKYATDPRHLLYREYLRVIRTHAPAVFVMENVKGLLSSMHEGSRIFDRILADLSKPADELRYEIRSFVVPRQGSADDPEDYVIRSELFGVPQARHRVILLGIRSDYANHTHRSLYPSPNKVKLEDVLFGMPAVRSRLSREPDSHCAWLSALEETPRKLNGWLHPKAAEILECFQTSRNLASLWSSAGDTYIDRRAPRPRHAALAPWLIDDRIGGVCQHQSRSHMRTDLHRYFFASSYANVMGFGPKLRDFPEALQPAHANAKNEDAPFEDRFRVQLWKFPSTTIVSHIAKDGHYFIHPDPSQCRSLTVREAARLQTFPDNYFFEGNRTEQYAQVGNAVPPFLAVQLAEVVADIVQQTVNHEMQGQGAEDARAAA